MYFTNTPSLNSMEAIMQKAPHLTQRGGGRNRSPFQYTKKGCDCHLCLRYRKKEGCTAAICPVLDIRLNCGASSFTEAVAAAFGKTDHPAFRRRLDQYIKKEGAAMIYENGWHRHLFQTEWQKLRKPDGKRLAVLYLLTADDGLWKKAKGVLKNGQVDFASAHLGGVDTESYALWKAVKEIQTGEKQISLCELANKKDISDRVFRLIVQSMTIVRFGAAVLNEMEMN